ncbi:MAG: hypothetical protein ACI4J4_08765 [Ruminiclostridium sp.]
MRKLKFTAAAAVAVLCISGFTASAAAEETEMSITAESVLVTDNIDLPDSDELFEGYVEKTFYGDYGASVYSTTARDNLSEADAKIYDALKPEIKKIANGEISSAKISVADSLLPKATFTPGELGVTSFTESTINTAKANINAEKLGFDFGKICKALMYDCPCELYWFDKTVGYGISYGISYSVNSLTVKSFTFNFIVSKDYSSSGTAGTYVTDTAKTSAAATAAETARTVVNENAGKTDIDKLFAYKEYICGEVSYNDKAASDSSTPYGNPWQLIYVFDKDSETNVVCEGYAKAFQYLCDLTAFNNEEIYCISVTGEMDGGGHMWNVMHMDDGKNYLVDITNSDTGTFGQDGSLFLSEYGSSDGNTSYTFSNTGGSKVTFVYDEDTTAIYSADELALSDDKYHWDYDGDGRCDEGGCYVIIDGIGATLAGYTLSLSGNIGVNFYMELSDTILNDSGAYMQFTLPNGTTEKVMVAEVKASPKDVNGKNFYIFPCEVAAKEMTAEIKAQMFDGNGSSGKEYAYTVKDYADYVLTHTESYSTQTVALVKAMLNYGAYSQLYFSYNTGKLANEGVTADFSAITADTIITSSPVYTKNESYTGSTAYYGSSLVLKSGTDIKHYFTRDTSIGIDKYTCTDSSSNRYEVAASGDYLYVRVPNIPAHKLGETLTLTLYENGTAVGTISNYSPMSYAYAVLNAYPTSGGEKDTLRNVVIALYHYYTNAIAA